WSAAQSPAPPAPRISTSVWRLSTTGRTNRPLCGSQWPHLRLVGAGRLALTQALDELDEVARHRLERVLHVVLRALVARIRRLAAIGGNDHDLSALRVDQGGLDLRLRPIAEAAVARERHPHRGV